jgi:ribosomal protein S27E
MPATETAGHVDGNAIGGLLLEVFGAEMTTATGRCGSCGTASVVAEQTVYLRAPGTVVRCPTCTAILMVFVSIQGRTCVDLRGLAELG